MACNQFVNCDLKKEDFPHDFPMTNDALLREEKWILEAWFANIMSNFSSHCKLQQPRPL